MAARAAELIAGLNYEGTYAFIIYRPPQFDPTTGEQIDAGGPVTNVVSMATIQSNQVAHLQNFAAIAGRLGDLASKELAQECFTAEDEGFVNGLMEGPDAFFPL